MDILFHPERNLGRTVTIIGEKFKISSVTKDMKSFRVEEEKHGVVHDYSMVDIEEAKVVTISVNGGESWIDIPVIKA